MAFKCSKMAVTCRSHLGIRLASEFKFLQNKVSRVSSQAGYDPLNSHSHDNSASRAGDDKRNGVRDTKEAVKDSITNVIDTAQAVGENTKKAMDTMWESANEGADTVKERIKDGGDAPSREDTLKPAGEPGIDEEWKRRLHHKP